MGHSVKKWVHLRKRVTLYKMGHIVVETGHTENVSHCEKSVTL